MSEKGRSTGEQPPEAGSSTKRRSLLLALLPLFTILPAGLFLIVRYSYEQFYTPLGLKPEEVGLSYLETLSRSGVELGVLIGLALAGIAVIELVWTLGIERWWSRFASKDMKPLEGQSWLRPTKLLLARWPRAQPGRNRWLRGAAILITVFFPTFLFFTLPDLVRLDLEGVQEGQGIDRAVPSFLGPLGSYQIGIEADLAELALTSGQAGEKLQAIARLDSLIYLGRNRETTVLYDFAADLPLRVPASEAAVLTHPSFDGGEKPLWSRYALLAALLVLGFGSRLGEASVDAARNEVDTE